MSKVLNDSEPNAHLGHVLARFLEPDAAVHGVLLYGSSRAPVLQRGQWLAQSWLCLKPLPSGACGECRACVAFQRQTLVDYLRVFPRGASRNIRVHWIASRPLEDWPQEEKNMFDGSMETFLRTPPLMSPLKVVLIENAERMMPQAAHALLKTLEEPHSYTKLILCTHELSSLLPTVISRCVTLPVHEEAGQDNNVVTGEIWRIGAETAKRDPALALKLCEDFRDQCAAIDASEKQGLRAANAKGLNELAAAVLASQPQRPEKAQAVIEAHRRIIGNGQASLVFDALFTFLAT
jgi:hypothetical protein